MADRSEHATGGMIADPRTIVTPDAFAVAPALLGTPLASPRRRLAAMAIDLAVIGVLTVLTQSFALVLGVVVAVLFIRAGFARISVPGTVFGRAMRASVGCLGVFVGFVTLVLWASLGIDLGGSRDDVPVGGATSGVTIVRPDVGTAIAGAASGLAFANAPDLETAAEAGSTVVTVGRDLGLAPRELEALLLDLVPRDAPWASEADALVARLIADSVSPDPALPPAGGTSDAPPGATEGVVGPAGVVSPALADSLDRLLGRLERLEEELARPAGDPQAGSDGLFARLRGFLDELGFGFGWASLYMTVMLSWWRGQTVGKRVLGIRVVRLDGEAINWWAAFERAGGYAAGFATGLLGFAQVYWDANRQGIHDRIAGTVVVRDGVPKVQGWESAL